MGLKTPLYGLHVEQGGKIVDFGGWDMPLHYGSQIEEHHAVRRGAGMFDVSHMAVVDLDGGRSRDFLRMLLANDVARLKEPGKALYTCMLKPEGGVIDDLIVYFLAENCYRLVVNAGTRDKDLAWIRTHAANFDVAVLERTDLGMIAVQGPEARGKAAALLPPAQQAAALEIKSFHGVACGSWFVARTGYTGEDGFEIMIPAADAADAWLRLKDSGVQPAGLGARDTLRLEAGMNLYGNDMDEAHHPLDRAWPGVAFDPADRDFIGRDALLEVRRKGCDRCVGLLLEERGVLRSHQKVPAPGIAGEGMVTSGTFSPHLESIDCAGARAGGDGHVGAGGNSRQAARGTRRSKRLSCATARQ